MRDLSCECVHTWRRQAPKYLCVAARGWGMALTGPCTRECTISWRSSPAECRASPAGARGMRHICHMCVPIDDEPLHIEAHDKFQTVPSA